MTYRINLDEVDVDGALRETAEAVSGDTRLGFLKKGGIAGGALMSGGAILSALAPSAFAEPGAGRPPLEFGRGDTAILNFALTLEYLERKFYEGAAGLKLEPQAAAFLKVVTRDEIAHVEFLKAALGAKAIAEPAFNFKGTNTTSEELFIDTSFVLENTGVHAYLGQIANIAHAKYLKAAGSIVTIEGRHAGVVGLLKDPSGESIAPSGPFDTPEGAGEIIEAVNATGFTMPLKP